MLRRVTLARTLWPAAQPELRRRFEPAVAREIFEQALAAYEERRVGLPRQPSAGGRIMVHLAALTIALYRALRSRDLDATEARRLTAAVTERAYKTMAVAPTLLSKIGTKPGRQRLERATKLFRRFPFSAPSYAMRDVETADGTVAFDVLRCPVAEYFSSQGLFRLCVESWCNLDYGLAKQWSSTLERPHTLAAGDAFCDFRWRPDAAQGSTPEPEREDRSGS